MKLPTVFSSLIVITLIASFAAAQQPTERRRLGILGGLAGAAIGAAAGEDSGDAVPGALIGGTIGAITGAAAGNSIDQQEFRNQQYQAAMAQQQAQAVTLSDVVSMTHAGLGDAVIINHIQTHGMAQNVTASDLIVLKQQGVSDPVLNMMQRSPQPRPVTYQPAPVIVREQYYAPPAPAWWYHQHYHYDHGHYHRPHGHSSIRFSFGH